MIWPGAESQCSQLHSFENILGWLREVKRKSKALAAKVRTGNLGCWGILRSTNQGCQPWDREGDSRLQTVSYFEKKGLKGGTYTTIDVPGALFTLGGGINNADLMTEVWLDSSSDSESSLYDGKKFTTIDVPKEESSSAGGISNNGDVVYSWEGSTETYGGALLHGGKYYKFHVPHGDRTFGYGINDKNVIVGAYTTDSGVTKGYSATY